MVLIHKIKAKKIISGRFGRKKTVEVDVYAPSTETHISEMAGHAAGVSDGEAVYATHTHYHYGDYKDEYILLGKKKGYDEFAYDAFIGILGGIASWKYGADEIDKKIPRNTGKKWTKRWRGVLLLETYKRNKKDDTTEPPSAIF